MWILFLIVLATLSIAAAFGRLLMAIIFEILRVYAAMSARRTRNHVLNPVFEHHGEWFFRHESSIHGPYGSEDACRRGIDDFCEKELDCMPIPRRDTHA